ncbi:MAG: hypothetical protein IJ418_21965 [Clostridia bacterium]|nr:hypothetical protein [Clostridia bacterium]
MMIDFNWIRATGVMVILAIPVTAFVAFTYFAMDNYGSAKRAFCLLCLLIFYCSGMPWEVIF